MNTNPKTIPTLPWRLPGCLSWSPWECRCLAEHQPKPELLHQWRSWIPSSNSATCCWPAACHWRPGIRHEEAMEDVLFYSSWFKSHSVSPQPLDHYSALLPCWTFSHVCSSPWLLQCPLVWELECSRGGKQWLKFPQQQMELSLCGGHLYGVTAVWVDLGFLCTLMLLMLTSVKELSLLFILCRVSSTFVGLGGSSNTGTIFSPLITSTNKHRRNSGRHIHSRRESFQPADADSLL